MSQTGPWSVKGIDARAREAARERARQEGMTLGEYLNSLILKGGEVGAQDIVAPIAAPKPRQPQAGASSLNKLVSRIEAAEARSTLAITGIDQSVVGLLKRLEDAETEHIAMARHVDGVIDDIRSTYDALRDKVRRIEEDDSAEQNLEALKALEHALGKLASHVYEESSLTQNETEAIKGRVESGFTDVNERLDSMDSKVEKTLTDAARRVEKAVEQAELRAEGTARHLSERMSALDTKIGRQERNEEEMNGRLQEAESRLGVAETAIEDAGTRVDAIEGDVTTALESMEGTLLRVQDRLNRAETTTDAALKSLEATFDVLDKRIGEVAKAAPEQASELREQFEARFEGLAEDLRASIAATREELAGEIEKAAKAGIAPEQLADFESKLTDVKQLLTENDERHAKAIETVGEQVNRISENFDHRLQEVESSDGSVAVEEVREEVAKLTETVQDRLDILEDREATAIERVGDEMTKIADQLDKRISDSEQRSASAIEQVGEQVSRVTTRLQTRQDEALQALSQKLEETTHRSETRLSDALANVSKRLDLMQRQSSTTLSPVQKAIASLATRLDSLEEFAAPPFADAPRAAALPEMRPLPINDPLFKEAATSGASGTAPTRPASTAVDPAESIEAAIEESEIARDVSEQKSAATASNDGFEPGIESWDDVRDDDTPKKPAAPTFSAEVPPANLAKENDPVAELESWEDSASEARDRDVFDDEMDAQRSTAQPTARRAPPKTDGPMDYLSSARAAARNAAAGAGTVDRKQTEARENRPKQVKPEHPFNQKDDGGSNGSSKLPLIATASVVALAAAGGTAYFAMQGNESVELQKIDTPEMPERIAKNENTNTAEAASVPPSATAELIATPPAVESPAVVTTSAISADSIAPVAAPNSLSGAPNTPARTEKVEATPEPAEPVVATAPPPKPKVEIAEIDLPVSLEAAANAGDTKALYVLGQNKLDNGDYAEGAALMKRSANAGEPAAQYRLGKLHEKGLGVPRDLSEARKWTEAAANGGNIRAMHDLAVFYAQGDGGPQSYAAAVNWFRKAAEFGVVDSQYNLGVLYERGIGIDPDPAEALFWFVIATRGGDAVSSTKVQELSKALPIGVAESASARAQSWKAKSASGQANGIFPGQKWAGITKNHISKVQSALNALGYKAGRADGSVGPATKKAIQLFQHDNGMKSTGTVTVDLIKKINEIAVS